MNICPQCGNDIGDAARFCFYCGFDIGAAKRKARPGDENAVKPASGPLLDGSLIGNRFRILREIGKGNRGIVYDADDIILEEKVALKVLYSHLIQDKRLINKFKREIKQARKIKHPNVCNIYDFGTVGDIFFISMEYLRGDIMSRRLLARDIQPEHYVKILTGLVRALEAAHAERIVHRDLNPSNIMLDPNSRPVVMNFGIARFMGQSDIIQTKKKPSSNAASFTCSPYYMAPEQFYSGNVDHRSDIYAFGVIAYELYTGTLPFAGDTPVALAIKHVHHEPPSPRTINPDIPEHIEQLILKCLQKKQTERFAEATDILGLLTGENHSATTERPKVVVADDNDNIRELIGTILEDHGCQVFFAKDGEEAIARVMQTKPALIILDLMMPVLDGYQAAEFLRDNSLSADIPIVMITSRIDEEYKSYSKSIGIKDHLTKPIDIEVLEKILHKHLSLK